MAPGQRASTLRQIRVLFSAGAAGGLTDAELVERFAAREGEAAELAFAALVERHSPMVLRERCRLSRSERRRCQLQGGSAQRNPPTQKPLWWVALRRPTLRINGSGGLLARLPVVVHLPAGPVWRSADCRRSFARSLSAMRRPRSIIRRTSSRLELGAAAPVGPAAVGAAAAEAGRSSGGTDGGVDSSWDCRCRSRSACSRAAAAASACSRSSSAWARS
jgi:hypothetical protein